MKIISINLERGGRFGIFECGGWPYREQAHSYRGNAFQL